MSLQICRKAVLAGLIAISAWLPATGNLAAQPSDPAAISKRIGELHTSGKYAEALPLAERLVALAKSRYGEASTDYANALEQLAATHFYQQNYAQAEPLYQQVLAVRERALGASHDSVLAVLSTLASVYRLNHRPELSQALLERVIAAREHKLGRDHPDLIEPMRGLAEALVALQNWGEAERRVRRALALSEKAGRKPTDRAQLLGTLAQIEQGLGRSDAAEQSLKQALALHEEAAKAGGATPTAQLAHMYTLLQLSGLYQQSDRPQDASVLMERVLSMMEKLVGPDHPNVATQLEVVAGIYAMLRRYGEAETLRKRAIAINERAYGREHQNVALSLQGLGHLYRLQDRHDEALPLLLRALEIAEKRLGPQHPTLVPYLTEIAALYRTQQRFDDAEALFKRALALLESAQGVNPLFVTSQKIPTLQSLGLLHMAQGRHQEGRPYLDRALAVSQELFGADHSVTGAMLHSIAIHLVDQGLIDDAERYFARALPIALKTGDELSQADNIAGMSMVHFKRNDFARAHAAMRDASARYLALDQRAGVGVAKPGAAIPHAEVYLLHAVAAFRLAETDAAATDALRDEAFQMMQRAQNSQAATSVGQMAARFASGTGALANLLRERQDLAAEWRTSDKQLTDALSALPAQRNSEKEQTLRSRLQMMAGKLAALDQRIAREFPAYAALTNPEPLSVASVQKLLAPSEALVLIGSRREQSLVWVVTANAAQWALVPLGEEQLTREVAALRCGLDSAAWDADTQLDCAAALGKERSPGRPLPFDVSRAHALHEALFGPFRAAIKDKHLLVAASGPLASLPLSVLVTEKPASAFPANASQYADVAWMAKSHAVSILPSVPSLASLRGVAKPSAARNPFLGIGNPLLTGPGGEDRRAWSKQACAPDAKSFSVRVAAKAVVEKYNKLFRGTLADGSVLRRQAPLPETADELCAVARDLGAGEADVALGSRATEAAIKQLNDRGQLAGYRVVHFATHGLLAGETESLGSKAEPALLLTPPDKATDADDGLLTASEVAKLRLDADWVVLSACNTAAGGKAGAQPFSGLAGAFFYAGARALLVSHWYVDSEAAVKLVTRLFAEAKRNPAAGRAEAVRQAMLAVMADTSRPAERSAAHPSVWAPFVIVGEGGAR
jgi:CHAT domain-containing protein/tetratricopeptide (TPR) repeat protein